MCALHSFYSYLYSMKFNPKMQASGCCGCEKMVVHTPMDGLSSKVIVSNSTVSASFENTEGKGVHALIRWLDC